MSRKEVEVAYLQSPTTMNGAFNTETTLSKIRTPHIKMYQSECGGLWIESAYGNAIIPATNVKIMMLKGGNEIRPETPTKPK